MSELTPEDIKQIVAMLSDSSWFDHLLSLLTVLAPFFAFWLSYLFFYKQHIQNAKGKVVEKDIDRLYEAADLFFDYSDALNLYLSMVTKKAAFLLREEEVPASINTKTEEATDAVYPKIHSIYKSYFYLLSLGAKDIADSIDDYRKKTIDLRKSTMEIARCSAKEDLTSLSQNTIPMIEKERANFVAARNAILIEIAAYKNNLISGRAN